MESAITMGPDGSPESRAAVRWAADEAERRKHCPALAPHPGPVATAAIPHSRCPVVGVPHD